MRIFYKVRNGQNNIDKDNSLFGNRKMSYGIVVKRYANNKVDIVLDNGMSLTQVSLLNDYSVADDKHFNGSRKLPPLNARVLVAFPDNDIPVVMGSSTITRDENNEKLLFIETEEIEEETDKDTELDIERTILSAGWIKEYSQKSGNFSIKGNQDDDDEKFEINVTKKDDDDEKSKSITLKLWNDHEIIINKNGLQIIDSNKNKVTTTDKGTEIEDKNKNIITMNDEGIAIKDKNSNEITLASGKVTIKSSAEIKLDGSTINLG